MLRLIAQYILTSKFLFDHEQSSQHDRRTKKKKNRENYIVQGNLGSNYEEK